MSENIQDTTVAMAAVKAALMNMKQTEERALADDKMVNQTATAQPVETGKAQHRRIKEYAAIRKVHAKPDFKAAQEAERAQGTGLDLGIHLYRRSGDTNGYYKHDEHGNEGEPLLFKGVNYIAARTGGGKTRFMCALAAQALFKFENQADPAHRKHVIFFSLEEPAKDIQKHIVTAFLNLKYSADETSEADVTAALLDQMPAGDKRRRIESGYSDLADLLTVIDSATMEEAKNKAAEVDATLNKDTLSGIMADVAGDIESLIKDAVADYGAKNTVFFVDYAQMIRDPEGAKSAASYKELQGVARHLISAAQLNAVLFVGAQVDRSIMRIANAKGDPRAHEFHTMTRENLREAADLEQSGNRIIYLTIDEKTMIDDDGNPLPYLNLRLLKNRQGSEHLYASVPIDFPRWRIDFSKLTKPTFGDASGSKAIWKEMSMHKQTVGTAVTKGKKKWH